MFRSRPGFWWLVTGEVDLARSTIIIKSYTKYRIQHENKQTMMPTIARANVRNNVVQLVARKQTW